MKEIVFSYLIPKELYLIAQVILDTSATIISRYQFLQLVVKRLEPNMEILQSKFGESQSSEFTDTLIELDDTRDNIYRGLLDYIQAFLKIGTAEQQEAAKHLDFLLEPFGYKVARQGYDVETVSIQKVLEVLTEEDAKSALEKITATSFVENLKTAEKNFEAEVAERNTTEVKEYSYADVKKAFAACFIDVKNLLNAFDVLLDEASDDELTKACDAINKYITNVMATARARKTRNETDEDEESTDETTE